MKSEIISISNQNLTAATSGFMKYIDNFLLLLCIWTETKNDGDTLKIRKKGVN